MQFVTLDFETANGQKNSACELGLTFVSNGEIVETRSWLIKPVGNRFDYFNTIIHGIKPEDVADKPTFGELWPEIRPLLEGQLVIAHNAGFDMGVLRSTLDAYELPLPSFQYVCSVVFSRRIWKGLKSYGLKTLCEHHQIKFRHHRAGSDSHATAQLCIKAFADAGISSRQDFPLKLGLALQKMG